MNHSFYNSFVYLQYLLSTSLHNPVVTVLSHTFLQRLCPKGIRELLDLMGGTSIKRAALF